MSKIIIHTHPEVIGWNAESLELDAMEVMNACGTMRPWTGEIHSYRC